MMKWERMTIGELQVGVEDAEIDAMKALNKIVADFREEYELNILGISVEVKYVDVGKPPRVVNVEFDVPFRRGTI